MWDGLFMLLTLSTVMAVASFLAGSLPLTLALSQRRLRLISAVGTGVLVGTSLIVIIPEGIETLYSASQTAHTRSAVQMAGAAVHGGSGSLSLHRLPDQQQARRGDPQGDPSSMFTAPQRTDPAGWSLCPRAEADNEDPHGAPHTGPAAQKAAANPHAWVGISLITGYILMYLIDTLPHLSSASHNANRPRHISLSNLSQGLHSPGSSPALTTPSSPSLQPLDSPSSASHHHAPAATIGLVIHALADGIALGASTASRSTRASLGLLVFLAIMLHKAPAAFGLTSVLLKQGLGKRTARAHLVVFSCAAPVGAVVTWFGVLLLGRGGVRDGMEGVWWTGVVLVFSGGTFLYVAMHSMQESHSSPAFSNQASNGYPDSSLLETAGYGHADKRGPTAAETAAVVVGMLLPLLTQIGHAHAHGR